MYTVFNVREIMRFARTFHVAHRFAYHDGLIEEVCPDPSEPTWVLNFKKGLLSMLQNTMRRFDIDYSGTETDVTGTCPISYMLFGAEGTSLLLQKTKDLAACTNRYKTHSFLQTVPYQFRQVRMAFDSDL